MHLVPLDKNENGRIESVENIFTDTEQLKWGIWLGKYPKSLISNVIASFSDVSHLTLEEQKFIQFLMTNGQEILVSSGISSLNFTERQSKLNALLTTPAISTQQTTGIFIPLLLIGLLFIVLSLIVLALFSLKQKNEQAAKASTSETKPIAINTIDVPKGLLYHPGHTWVFMEKDGNVKMGIDSFLSQLTGKITRIEVKAEGESVKKGETIVTLVQKGKQLNIKAPFSGIVREVNDELLTATELLNQSPFDKGWIYTLEASDWLTDVQLMFQSDRYLRWIQNEFDRVKELLRRIVQNKSPNNTAVVLLDGGAIREKILEEFGPENWEEFQQEFLS